MERQAQRRITFIEQATRLINVYPEIKDEITWRISHLNSKWDAVKQAMSLVEPQQLHIGTLPSGSLVLDGTGCLLLLLLIGFQSKGMSFSRFLKVCLIHCHLRS